jgi:cell division initiation protein
MKIFLSKEEVSMSKPFAIVVKKFNKEFRGYSQMEVDNHLQNAQKYIDELYSENMQLKEMSADAQVKLEQYQQMENTMQSTLFVAQETAEEIRVSAQKEKELVLAEAEKKARQAISEAEAEAARIESRMQSDLRKVREEYGRTELKIKEIIDKARNLLETELRLLNDKDFSQGPAVARETAEEAKIDASGEQEPEKETTAASLEPLPTGEPQPVERAIDPAKEESGEQAEIRRRMEEVLRQSEEIREQLKKKSKASQ